MTTRAPKYQPGDDLLMMQDVDEWPLITLLPLKNRNRKEDNFPAPGFLYCPLNSDTPKPVVYLSVIFGLEGKKLGDLPQQEYDSFQAILDDGWIVD